MDNKSLINLALILIELDPEAEENRDIIESSLKALGDKVESYHFLKCYSESQIDLLKKEREHLTNEIKKHERTVQGLKDRAMYVLESLGISELKSDNGHKLSIRESDSVQVDDLTKLPEMYVRKKVIFEADKLAIKEAIKSGEHIDGAQIVKNKSIVIK